jgi:glycosyltransferase involved in cell wall biosynthesis
MSIKVLHVYRTYFPDLPGGVQEAIRQISAATEIFGVESRIFVLSPTPSPQKIDRPEGRVTRSQSWAAPASCDIGGYNALKSFREEVDWADVIQYHFPWPFADVLHFMGRVRKPAVMTYHSDIVRQRVLGSFYAPLMKRMLGSMNAVVATSPTYALTSTVLTSCVSPERLKTIPLGIADYRDCLVDVQSEYELLDRCSVRDKPFVLALGAMRYYKGFHTLVEAALTINAPIVIAGSGPEEQSLKNLAAEKGATNVIFVGQISDKEKISLLRNCNVFALPSHLRSEAFGMVLVEASMFGKPMVSCEIGSGTSYVNKHGETGFVVHPESPNHFSDAVNSLLSNRSLEVKMGLAARKRYEQIFSDAALGRAYSTLYREVTNQLVLK